MGIRIFAVKLIMIIIAAALVKILILLPLFSDTNFEIEIGIARVEIVKNSE